MTRYQEIVEKCGPAVTVVAVSKRQPLEKVLEAYDEGCRDFGENRVPDALERQEECPEDIRWHFIGTLQRKKVPKVLGRFALIHAVDTLELAMKLEGQVLLQFNTSGEAQKHGFGLELTDEVLSLFERPQLQIEGLMTMAPFSTDEGLVRGCFAKLRELKGEIEGQIGRQLPHLSMGMSNDFEWAVDEGATIVRVGGAIFGE